MMSDNGSSSTNSSRPRPSSLLSKALDIPSLNHQQNQNGAQGNKNYIDGHSETSSSSSPSASAPEDIGDSDKESNGYRTSNSLKQTPPYYGDESSSTRMGSMSSFDTPVIRNNDVANPVSREPPQMVDNTVSYIRNSSVQSIDSSIVNGSVDTNPSYVRGDDVPGHSDYTIPTSNPSNGTNYAGSTHEPPLVIRSATKPNNTTGRSILGNIVGKKYHCSEQDRRPNYSTTYGSIPSPPILVESMNTESTEQQSNSNPTTRSDQQQDVEDPDASKLTRSTSRMTPRILPTKEYPDYDDYFDGIVEKQPRRDGRNPECHELLPKGPSRPDFHKSVYAQSLLVCLAFMAIWLPNNAMAPNLTEIAHFFGMNEAERDLYLGSYCALALGVFSLPLSGGIGFMADFYSRKDLFVACLSAGALSSAWSGWSQNFFSIFLSRLCSGGCMSGSLSVTFSMLGDLFSTEERSAASSGLSSAMGLGILIGQVFAGEVGPTKSWQYPFFVSALIQLGMASVIFFWVDEPLRGGKEKALQDVFESGNKYERKLTLRDFVQMMYTNSSNWILLWYGYLTSLPWGVVFVFLNDYLSQEKGFSVEEATFLVMIFGAGCALGGIIGGYLGQVFNRGNRSNIPLYMAASTFLGIFPFMVLFNSDFPNHSGLRPKFYAIIGGCIASLPSVNVRPCIINVNPPESRGAALTICNLFVTLGRGMGPSCIVYLGSAFHASRSTALNLTLSFFWTISGIQLVFLAKTLPRDQDAMEEELARYAVSALGDNSSDGISDQNKDDEILRSPVRAREVGESGNALNPTTPDRPISWIRNDDHSHDYDSIISSPPAQYMTIDGASAKDSLEFVKLGIQEFGDEITFRKKKCIGCDSISPSDSDYDIQQVVDDENKRNLDIAFASNDVDPNVVKSTNQNH